MVVAVGCSDRPDDVMSEKKLVAVMSDMRIAEAMFTTGQGSATGFSSREEAELGVLRKHAVTPEEYRKTIRWYGENLDKFDQVNKDVNKNLKKRIAKIDPAAAERVTEENNIWPYPDHLIYRPGMTAEGLTFSISQPDIERGGYAELKMKISDPQTTMAVVVGIDYEDGSMSYIGRTVSGFPQIKIRVQSDTARRVKRLFGYLQPQNKLQTTVTFDSISLIKMPLDSNEYYRISSQIEIDRPVRPSRSPRPIRKTL